MFFMENEGEKERGYLFKGFYRQRPSEFSLNRRPFDEGLF